MSGRRVTVTGDGATRIMAERQRQIAKEGWTPEHDDEHDDASLLLAAVCYTANAAGVHVYQRHESAGQISFCDPWPETWAPEWDKRPRDRNDAVNLPQGDARRIRMLEKAGALIAAEIDRLLRKEPVTRPARRSK